MKKLLASLMTVSLTFSMTACLRKPSSTDLLLTSTPMQQKGGGEEKMRLEDKKILMVVAPTNFRDEELQEPREIFQQDGGVVSIASKGVSEAEGMLGARVDVDLDLSEVSVSDYDAVVFVGGTGASVYFDSPEALRIAKEAYEQGKVVGAICIAPSILANSGILSGKKATAFISEEEKLIVGGAQFTGEAVTVDGKLVTADGPTSATAFGQKIVEVLSSE